MIARTYIPQKHKQFWKPKLFFVAYGGVRHRDLITMVIRDLKPSIECTDGVLIDLQLVKNMPVWKLNNNVTAQWKNI